MYLSDDLTEQELLDTAAEQREHARRTRESDRAFQRVLDQRFARGPWAVPEEPAS